MADIKLLFLNPECFSDSDLLRVRRRIRAYQYLIPVSTVSAMGVMGFLDKLYFKRNLGCFRLCVAGALGCYLSVGFIGYIKNNFRRYSHEVKENLDDQIFKNFNQQYIAL